MDPNKTTDNVWEALSNSIAETHPHGLKSYIAQHSVIKLLCSLGSRRSYGQRFDQDNASFLQDDRPLNLSAEELNQIIIS